MPQVPKMAPPRGHMFYIGLYREKHEQIFLSETVSLRALIGHWLDMVYLPPPGGIL